MPFDVAAMRAQFPVLERRIHDRPLVYLDHAASAQKPQAVIDAISEIHARDYANVHRGLHTLSNALTDRYEAARATVARFLGVTDPEEVVFTRGTTEAINLVAASWAAPRLDSGDEIVLSTLEHHANIVPWHFLRTRQGVRLVWVDPEPDGSLDPDRIRAALTPRTRLIAVTHMSNVLGTLVDLETVVGMARARDIPVVVDGSQAAAHVPVDLGRLDPDFYAVTGHKLCGPNASGALRVAPRRVHEMRPFMGGGDMIAEVTKDDVRYAAPPMMFEAGTPAIVPQIGLAVALDWLSQIGMEEIAAHEADLTAHLERRLGEVPGLTLLARAPRRGPVASFTMEGCHPSDLATLLDRRGIAVRAGHHCAGPLMEHLGCPGGTLRASCGPTTTRAEIDALAEALVWARDFLA